MYKIFGCVLITCLLVSSETSFKSNSEELLRIYEEDFIQVLKHRNNFDPSRFSRDVSKENIFSEELYETSKPGKRFNFKRSRKEPKQYDFIIVGGGSTGCVLANRLSEVKHWDVLLIEAGKPPNTLSSIPFFVPSLYFTNYTSKYRMEKQPGFGLGLQDEKIGWPRGKALGGSSVINYMIYTRGHPLDFDRWAEAGNPGWSYSDVLHYFMKSERANNLSGIDNQYHGFDGPLSVSDSFRTPLARSFVDAGKEMGYPEVDYTGPNTFGFSTVKTTTFKGRRNDAATAFILPYKDRKNLHVKTSSHVAKLLIDRKNKKAYGVKYIHHGRIHAALAKKEVILSAGVFGSPQLLMLSGIGPKDHLEELGIPLLQNLAVGQNLHDHICYIGLPLLVNDSSAMHFTDTLNPLNYLKFITTGNGPLASTGGIEGLAFIKTEVSDERTNYPDIELVFSGTYITNDLGTFTRRSWGIGDKLYKEYMAPLHRKRVFTISPSLLHPKSTGWLRLQSKSSLDAPKFYGNYVSDPENKDMKTMIASIRFILKLIHTPAFQKHGVRVYDMPVPGCENFQNDFDQYWECAIRTFSVTLHHQVGTCKMGPSTDPGAVVSPRLNVYGIEGLRVADTSIIPFAISGHTNAPTIMVGEKAADFIKEDWGELNYKRKE